MTIKTKHPTKICNITGQRLPAKDFGQKGCSVFSKEALNHWNRCQNLAKSKYNKKLGIIAYRDFMGYPQPKRGRTNGSTLPQRDQDRLQKFLKNSK